MCHVECFIELPDNHKITARLGGLRERAATTVVLTRAWVLEHLMRNFDLEMQADDFTASN